MKPAPTKAAQPALAPAKPDPAADTEDSARPSLERALAHGRRLDIDPEPGADLVEVRAPDGTLEVRIRITADGPVLELSALRLALSVRDQLSVACGRFALSAREGARVDSRGGLALTTAGELHMAADGYTRVSGEYVLLNCDPDFVVHPPDPAETSALAPVPLPDTDPSHSDQ